MWVGLSGHWIGPPSADCGIARSAVGFVALDGGVSG